MLTGGKTETRLQKSQAKVGESALQRIVFIARDMFKHEGFRAFYQGITPRVMRVAPGQVHPTPSHPPAPD